MEIVHQIKAVVGKRKLKKNKIEDIAHKIEINLQ